MSDYPKKGGEVRIDYLIQIAKTCHYPNLAYELALHPYSVATAAAHADVSMDVLVDVLRGEDEFTASEAVGLLWFASQYSDERVSYDYLFSHELTTVDMSLPENIRRVEQAVHELGELRHPHTFILNLLRGDEIPEAAIACAHKHFKEEQEMKRLREHKPRTKRLSALEEESEGGLEIEFVFGEEANTREEAAV